MANGLTFLDRALLGGKFLNRGLQARPMPLGPGPSPAPAGLTTASAQGRGLGFNPLSPGRSAAAGGLRGLSQLLAQLAAGQPQNAAAAFGAGVEGFDEQQARKADRARQDEIYGLELEDRYEARADRAEDKSAAAQAKRDRDAAIDALPIDDDLKAALKTDVVKYGDIKPTEVKPPASRTRVSGGKEIFEEFDPATKTWKEISSGDRWKPEGEGIQIDTNGDGFPDVTIGGKGIKPLSGDASQQTLRATLIDTAQKDLAAINFDNVSAGKSAVGGWMSENPVGEAVAGAMVLNDDEKKLLGAQAMIQEAVISAITGAAYTEEQKRNMRAAMVPLATDSPTRRMEKLKAAGQFLKQLDKNSGYNRLPNDAGGGSGGDMYDEFGLERPQ